MSASSHFGLLALPNFPRILKSGVGAHFVYNTLKYNIKPSNFVSQRLVTKPLFLTLLTIGVGIDSRFCPSSGEFDTTICQIPCIPSPGVGHEIGKCIRIAKKKLCSYFAKKKWNQRRSPFSRIHSLIMAGRKLTIFAVETPSG